MTPSNLPPGCTSDDGGIDHEYEAAEEKALDLAQAAGLTATELVSAMRIGIAAIKELSPLIDEAAAELKAENASLCAALSCEPSPSEIAQGDGSEPPTP